MTNTASQACRRTGGAGRGCVKLAGAMQSIRWYWTNEGEDDWVASRAVKDTGYCTNTEGFTRSRHLDAVQPAGLLGTPPSSCETVCSRLLLLIPTGERTILPGDTTHRHGNCPREMEMRENTVRPAPRKSPSDDEVVHESHPLDPPRKKRHPSNPVCFTNGLRHSIVFGARTRSRLGARGGARL
jgi:hypothetical protein